MGKLTFRFFLFPFIASNCFCEYTRHVETMINDPSAIVDGKVNAITGHPCIYSEDVVIQGAEPIRLSRVYLHAERDGYWKLPGNPCMIYQDGTFETGDKNYQWIINEPDGCPIYFKPLKNERVFDGKKYKEFYPSNLNLGFSNTSQGEISSRTNHHNYRAFFDKKSVGNNEAPKRVFLHAPDGRVREYKRTNKKPYFYLLLSEQLPSGNWVLYEYGTNEKETETFNKLLKIETKNLDKSKVFASASFKHTKYKDDKDCKEKFLVTGSDGQRVEYYCEGGK